MKAITVGFLFAAWCVSLSSMAADEDENYYTSKMLSYSDVDLGALTDQTQILSQKNNHMTQVWWIPLEYWHVVAAQSGNLTEKQLNALLLALSPYVIVAVSDGAVSPSGVITYNDAATIHRQIALIDGQFGNDYDPLPDEQVSSDARNTMEMFKSALASNLGPFGQNTHFVFFSNKESDGHDIVGDSVEKSLFTITLGEQEFRYEMPLEAFYATKYCARCDRDAGGSWANCPWCAGELQEAKTAKFR